MRWRSGLGSSVLFYRSDFDKSVGCSRRRKIDIFLANSRSSSDKYGDFIGNVCTRLVSENHVQGSKLSLKASEYLQKSKFGQRNPIHGHAHTTFLHNRGPSLIIAVFVLWCFRD